MSTWTPDRIPITVAPLPGEALEILTAMTLDPYDGLAVAIAVRRGQRTLARPPAGRSSGARARYCPACLRHDDGRGPLTWRLPWSFACPIHRVLLLDVCPACHRPPRPWNARRLGPPAGGACTRDSPSPPTESRRRRGMCGADLTRAPAIPLPATGTVLAAHRHLAELMASEPGARPAALAGLKQVYAVAWRALRGLHTIPGRAPQVVHTVLDECRTQPPGLARTHAGRDAPSAAIGAALAHIALDDGHPHHEVLFDWILQADRFLLKDRKHKPGIGAIANRWTWSGPELVSRVLGRLDAEASLHARLRYSTASPRPRWPDLPAAAISRRAAMIPAMLWPGWTMRLLPPPPGRSSPREADPRTSAFRRGCSSFLLLPGGPPLLNFERAGPLLGNHQSDTDRGAVERRIYHHHDLTPLASVLAQLAFAVDEHGCPIDYARRRALFTGSTITLDLDAYARLRLQHAWSAGYAPRVAVLRWYLFLLLTGEHPAPGAKKPFGHQCTEFRFQAPRPLRVFLRQQAQTNLACHGITEPVTWEPPPHWVTCPSWPGAAPASISQEDYIALLETAGSVHDAAGALGLTPEHIRLHCEITDTGTPPATANGIPVPPTREDILGPAHLRDLYEYQHLPVTEIAGMAGCATATIRRLLQHDGVPRRRNYRRPPPESGITRAWLEREYAGNLRSIGALARERNVTAHYLMSLAKNWGLPIRGHRHYSGIGHLNLPSPPSPAIRAVTMRSGALRRLALITQIPGHTGIAAAARDIYDGRAGALRQKIRSIEKAAGFTIIDRSATPLTPTEPGHEFIQEALQILRIARETDDRT